MVTTTLQLDIPIVLPGVSDSSDACVQRLISDLQGRDGLTKVHIKPAAGDATAQLCVHYDPDILSLTRIREIVHGAGAAITARFGHAVWQTTGIGHQRRARTVADRLWAAPGVLEAGADAGGVVRVEFDREKTSGQTLRDILADMGVQVQEAVGSSGTGASATPPTRRHDHPAHDHQDHGHADHDHPAHKSSDGTGDHAGHDHSHGALLGPNTELFFSLICGGLLAAGYVIDTWILGLPGWLPTALYLGAYVFGGVYTLREAVENLRLRKFEIDTLMLVAAAGAAALGAFAEGALLLFLFSLGHALEHYAMGRARQAIEALAQLAPRTATVRRDGGPQDVVVEELVLGDVVIVRPDARLPADGFLIKGISSINQAPVTGESIPVDKRPVDDIELARVRPGAIDSASQVFAGTINGAGAIEIEVTRLSSESALARVVRMVNEAETQKSPTQRFTDRFERIFVPAVLALATILLFAWVVIDEPFSDSFYRAMAVLVAASPCALAIATPSAVLSGVARAARSGVLIKGGAPLENLGGLSAIAFDKTGTLTEGRPRITDIVPVDGASEDDLLRTSVAVESLSDHPLATAIVRDGRDKLSGAAIREARDLKSFTGKGLSATLDGQPVWIGKAEMFGTDGIAPLGAAARKAIDDLRAAGRTTMVVRRGEADLGVIGLMDTPRQAAHAALERLRAIGIKRMIMISGDNQTVAEAIARDVGIDEAWGDLMPEHKVDAIRKLRTNVEVAMVGDGVNDAPAMANATVGIAMGAAGSDVALETADVALMTDDLSRLPFAVGLSRHTRSIIRQNVFISMGIVAVLVPATIFGLGIGPAVAVHEGSTLIVVFNALRLLAWRES